MIRPTTIALLALVLLLAPQTTASTVTGTSSTGDIDTWGVTNLIPCEPGPATVPQIDVKDLSGSLQGALDPVDHCFGPCPTDIFFVPVTLHLLDPNPIDHVAITVVGDPPAFGPIIQELTTTDPSTYPTAVATFSNPEVHVWIQLGGCNRTTTVVVTGIVVEGEVNYELSL